jgi:hypothetical protein
MEFHKIIIASLIIIFLGACSSTKTTATWSNDDIDQLQISKVAVLGIMNSMSTKHSFENEMAARLHKEGIAAIAAHQIIPPRKRKANVQEMIRKLHKEGVDMVMVVSVSDIERNRSYVPGSSYVQPRTYYNRFGDYYVNSYRRVYTPGYMRRSTTLFLESTLYDLENQQLVWTSETKSTDPISIKSTSRSYAKSIVKALDQDQII